MANTGVQGQVIFTGTTSGIQGLVVQVVDYEGIPDEQSLGWGSTNASGHFNITYSGSSYGTLEWQPDIVVRIFDLYGRLLHETVEVPNVSSPILLIPTISLHPNTIDGWLVTNALINPGGTPVIVSPGNAIEFLIDNEIGWSTMTDAVSEAASSINFMILYFEVPDVVTKFVPSKPPMHSQVGGDLIQKKMLDKATEGKTVRVLANDFSPDFFGNLDTATEVTDFFRGTRVETRLYPTTLLSPMHAKLLIIDGSTAFLVSSPVMQEYWDASTHFIADPRRGAMNFANSIKVPIHDVSVKLSGPAVEHIDQTFTTVWDTVAPTMPATSPTTGQAAKSSTNVASVQVVRTLPGNKFPSAPHGETGILEAYQRAIAKANHFIYIEDQYFTSTEIADALIRRLLLNTNLHVVLLLNIKVDIPGYQGIQTRVIRNLLEAARLVDAQKRLGIFTLWSHSADTPRTLIMRNYVHSKVAIIDDLWATVGSANTDGTSMNHTQVFDVSATFLQQGRPTQHANPNMPIQPWRAVELNIAIYNDIAGQPATSIIGDLRRRLWTEHLGYASPTDAAIMISPEDGKSLLDMWDARSSEKLNGLKLTAHNILPQRILPWASPKNAIDNLSTLGIDVTKLNVIDEVGSFDFTNGEWKTKGEWKEWPTP